MQFLNQLLTPSHSSTTRDRLRLQPRINSFTLTHAHTHACMLITCAHASMLIHIDERTQTHTSPCCVLFSNFEKMDYFLRVRLAQRLLPLPISHLSLISLGMNVCIIVCIGVYVCVCVCMNWCMCVFALLQMPLCIDGWPKQKQIHQSVKSHIIFHHLAINHRCECASVCAWAWVRARQYMCMCVI